MGMTTSGTGGKVMAALWDTFVRPRGTCAECNTVCAITKAGRCSNHNAMVDVGLRKGLMANRRWLTCPGSKQLCREATPKDDRA